MSYKPMSPSQGFDLDNPNQPEQQDGPVECLGKTFANDQERREHYLALLAEKLKDPEFRKIEGFPIGEDEDIYCNTCKIWISNRLTPSALNRSWRNNEEN
jgi:hypothetical protein